MNARAGLALAVTMALAVGHIKAERSECMRSLVSGRWAWAGIGLPADSAERFKRQTILKGLVSTPIGLDW